MIADIDWIAWAMRMGTGFACMAFGYWWGYGKGWKHGRDAMWGRHKHRRGRRL